MSQSVATGPERLHETRRWIFRWRGLDGMTFRGFLALIITAGVFVFFAATVRIRVSAPQQWVERKASVIHLPEGGEGHLWAMRAQENGPYPARFDVNAWEKQMGSSDSLIGLTRLSQEPYEPKPRSLPESGRVITTKLADQEERVFPKHRGPHEVEKVLVSYIPVPILYPRSGIKAEELPKDLPPLHLDQIGKTLDISIPRDYLIELDRDGRVIASTDLSGNPDAPVLREWLGKLNFGPEIAKKSPMLPIAVGFSNQPVNHGSDSR